MRDESSLPQPGDTIAGKYVLERVLGEGGMSVVYGATHRVTGKRFAIKWLLPDVTASSGDTARRFIREAQVAGLFQHPNVVEVYDVGQIAGSFYMVMEWLEGESLAERLERAGKLSFDEVCTCLIPCMHGVVEAHAAGIVHRDLKPANIFLCRAMHHTPERPKVLDFGIAKMSKPVFDVNSLVTKSGVLIGTPHYLSPEQLRSLPVDHRTDVYALGVIMYQLLTGRLPFPAENFGQLVLQIATGTPVPLRELAPDLPEGAEAIVERAMAREPADRFQDVRELIGTLEEVWAPGALPNLGPATPRSHPPVTPRPTPPISTLAEPSAPSPRSPPREAKRSRKALRLLTLAAASALVIGGLALLLRLWNQPPSAAEERVARDAPAAAPSSTAAVPPPLAPITTTSAATAPAGETVAPHEPPAAIHDSEKAQADTAAGARAPGNLSRSKRPARAAPPSTGGPAPAAQADPAVPPPAPTSTPAPERNPLDMRLQ